MAFTDPQTVTINAIANPLPKISTGVNTSTYSKDDGTVVLTAAHSYGKANKRARRTVRIDHSKIAPDPFIPTSNVRLSMSAYLVVDAPLTGYTIVEQKQIVDGLIAWLSATSGANVTKLLGGES